MNTQRTLIALAIGAIVGALLLAMSAGAASADTDTIRAGHDLFMSPPGESYQDVNIPGSDFGSGCEDFNDRIVFEGVPFDSFGGHTGLSPTDTIVERLEDANPTAGRPATIRVQIVRLELKAEITVTCNGVGEVWDVVASVPEGDPEQVAGEMTIYHHEPNGGTFDSTLKVRPLISYTQRGGTGSIAPTYYPEPPADPIEFVATNVPWCHDGNPIEEPLPGHRAVEVQGLTTNFFPNIICPDSGHGETGTNGMRTMCLEPEEAMLAQHGILPAANSQVENVLVCNVPTPASPPEPTVISKSGTGLVVEQDQSSLSIVVLAIAGAALVVTGVAWRLSTQRRRAD